MATSRPQGSFKVELGETFNNNSSKSFHTLRYNFKPSSVAWSQHGRLKVNGRGVELQIDGADDGDETTIFRGNVDDAKDNELFPMTLFERYEGGGGYDSGSC